MTWTEEQRSQRMQRQGVADQRSEYERDRDRILYSSAFQRLAGITQIVRAGEADVFHTRQQHTIKVAQIGRRLAQAIVKKQPEAAAKRGLDPEVVEAACLAHDLGHPPFGHIGEHVLDELVSSKDTDGFEGNAQSFRILTKLAVRFAEPHLGMDLTRATLAATLKYPWHRASGGKKNKKWSAYQTETDAFKFAREFHQHDEKTLEAEVMDWADDVAYSVHDLEDFHRCNVVPWRNIFENPEALIDGALKSWPNCPADAKDRLDRAFERLDGLIWSLYETLLSSPYEGTRDQREQLRRMTSQLIGNYMASIEVIDDDDSNLAVNINPDHSDEIKILKQITRDYIIGHPSLLAQQRGQGRIIKDLFGEIMDFMESKGEHKYPPFLPVRLRYFSDMAGTSTARFAADCVGSLSEREAGALHARLFGLSSGSVLDPIVR